MEHRNKMALFAFGLVLTLLLAAPVSSLAAKGEDGGRAADSCCELFGLWVFAHNKGQGSFLPNHRFLWNSRIYVYDCSGPTITFDWERPQFVDVHMISANVLEYKDMSGRVYKAVRKKNTVVVNGKKYKACPSAIR